MHTDPNKKTPQPAAADAKQNSIQSPQGKQQQAKAVNKPKRVRGETGKGYEYEVC